MDVLCALGVIPQQAKPIRQFIVVGHHGTGVTVAPEIFPGIDAEAPGVTTRAHWPSPVMSAVGLTGIFDYLQIMSTRYGEHSGQIYGMAVKMDGHNGLRLRSDSLLEQLDVEGVIAGVNVDEDRHGSGV